MRTDERREIRQAIRAFQQFRYTKIGVNYYNFVPNVPFRPDFYFYTLVISMIILALHTYFIMVNVEIETIRLWILLMRNICTGILVTWLVLWYSAAFNFIKKELYQM